MEKDTEIKKEYGYYTLKQATVISLLYFGFQYACYRVAYYISLWVNVTPISVKLPLDDMIPLVSVFIIPYIYAFFFWISGLVIISRCDRQHYSDYLAANLICCLITTVILVAFPAYMDRAAEGLLDFPENPSVFEWIRRIVCIFDGWEVGFSLLPSFHCISSTICILGVTGRKEFSKGFKVYTIVAAVLIMVSTLFVKQHYFLDTVTGIALALIVYFPCKKYHWGRMFAPLERRIDQWIAEHRQ
ncbi:MAG: phosphatase PAP2 family protein [Firmicutes bacterium]|nr:phosphatase PAP2 family protein [Bacillota bacterium]